MKRKYAGTFKERRNQSVRNYRLRDPERTRRQWREYKTRKLLVATKGRVKPSVCDVCGNGGKICFDHSHAHGNFRGWLCNRCNLILGHAKDNPEILRKLATYLEQK
jgi:hypothetical protein